MTAKVVTYHVRLDGEAGVFFGEREDERVWTEAGFVGQRDRRVVSIQSSDNTTASLKEVVEFVDGEAMGERNRSGKGTGRGYSTRRVIHVPSGTPLPKGMRARVTFKRFTRCSSAPFRLRRAAAKKSRGA